MCGRSKSFWWGRGFTGSLSHIPVIYFFFFPFGSSTVNLISKVENTNV